MSGELGRASLELEVDLGTFERDMQKGHGSADDLKNSLDALAAMSKIAENALKQVRMSPGQGAESKGSAESIVSGVRGVSEEARTAARELDKVKLTSAQAAESAASGDVIDRKLKDVTGNANEARRALESVRLASAGNPGAGIGPFGSGFGRVGVLGTAVSAGVLTAPAAAPAALGALAAIPALSAAAAGSIGTLALAFDGVGKAISGDKKAFDDLGPAAQQFTLTVRSLDGELDVLRQTAGGALFPGLTEALHSALSPGTLAAVTNAIKEFGAALGQAGAQWGRYFGSTEFQSIFVPLMHAGAHEMSVMAAATLALFDAFGVLGRAAIPFTNWLVSTIDHGAKFVDTWLHAKDATGQLGQAMNEAKTSLEIVGRLFGSLVSVVLALGGALYPVSKIAVKDLTDGLNALAGIIKRNQEGIREIVGGALAALVSTVKTLAPLVAKLAHTLNDVVHAIGGWKVAFELVISGFLAFKFVALAGAIAKIGPALAGIGASAVTTGAEVGGLRAALLGLGAPEVLLTLAAVAAALKLIDDYRSHHTQGHAQTGGSAKLNTEVFEQGGSYYQRVTVGRSVVTKKITPAQAKSILAGGGGTPGGADRHGPAASRAPANAQSYSQAQLASLWIQAGGDPAVAGQMAAIAMAESGGRTSATNSNTNGTTDRGLWQINSVHGYAGASSFDPLQNAKQAVSVYNSQGITAWSTYNNGAYKKFAGQSGTSPFGEVPAFTKNTGTSIMPTGCHLIPLPKKAPTRSPATVTVAATVAA